MITLNGVEQIHKILIEQFGGTQGVRDYSTLSSPFQDLTQRLMAMSFIQLQ